MFWRVVKLDAPEQFGCALYSQDIFKGLVKPGVETVQGKMNPACPGIGLVRQVAYDGNKIDFGTTPGHCDGAMPSARKAPAGRTSDGDWPGCARQIVQRLFQPAIPVCRARAPDHHVSIARIDHSEDSFYRISRLTAHKLIETPAPRALQLRSNRSLNPST